VTEFQNALARYLQGQLDIAGLESSLRSVLQQQPGIAPRVLETLDHLFRTSRLRAQDYIALKTILSEAPPADATPAPPQPPGEQAPPFVPPEETPASGQRTVFAPPAAEQPQDAQPPPAEPPRPPEPQPPTAQPPRPPEPQPPPAEPPQPPEPQPPTAQPPQPPEPRQPPTEPPPPGQPTEAPTPTGVAQAPSGAADEPSDILDILQSGDSAPSPPPEAPAAGDGGPEPSDDRTVFRQSAPPSRPHTQSSVPQTGTGAPLQTGPSGGMSVPTGASSIPTGTGSNWTDPSKWGGGPAPTMQPGSILKDRYVLETIIGRGGMGVVFKARDLRREEAQDRNPYIAVKILNDEFRRHPESLKALQRESRKAQDLAHPNIVTVFDFDRDGQTVYMTMEFLEGQSLDRLTKDPTFDGMPFKEAYLLIEGLGHALGYAHRKGVVHSDFKPANTFLTQEGVIKVFDFGIARAAKLPGQKSGDMTLFDPGSLGALTPAYASCEMIEGQEPDARDDIYALACLAYELLTGRHPFDKRPADEARDNGLKVEPVRDLNRRSWRGLQRGLAFQREDRTPDIETFLADIRLRKLNKTTVGVAAAATVAAIALGAVLGPGYIQDLRVDRLITSIVEGDETAIETAMDDILSVDIEIRDAVIADGQVEDRLIEFYLSRIEDARFEHDYPRAEGLLQEARSWYDDSNSIENEAEEVRSSKSDKLQELDERYNAHLQSGNIMPSDGDDITDVLKEYKLVDPGNAALVDDRLAIAYADLAQQLLGSDVLRASRVIDEGQLRFPDDARLIGIRDQVNTLRDVQDKELRVAELEQQLSAVVASATRPADFREYQNAIFQLDTLDPDSEVLAGLRARVDSLLDERIEMVLDNNDWASARILLDEYSSLASPTYAAAARQRVDAQAAEFDDSVGGAYASVEEAVRNGNLDEAAQNLAQLQQLGAAATTIRQAREIVSRGYLAAAQAERSSGRYDSARARVEAGKSVDPAFPGWQAELDAIGEDERLAGQALAAQEREQLQQERQTNIDSLRRSIQSDLATTPFDIESARTTLDSIDRLARLDPGAELARNGRREVAAKLATQARGLAARDGNFDAALVLVAQSIELLPTEGVLRQVQDDLVGERQASQQRIAAEQEQELRAELDRLLASPAYDRSWDNDLRRVFQGLEPIAGNTADLGNKRRAVATLYVSRAESLRAEERFDLAEQMLTASAWYVADFDAANRERQVLTEARRAFADADRERQLKARIDGLKRSFTTELNAERIDDARNTLATLRELLPSGDAFVGEAPQQFAATYSRMATRAFGENRFDRAEQLARLGLNEVPGHNELTRLVAEIGPRRLEVNLGSLRTAIQSGDPTDAARPKQLLEQVRRDAGSGYPGIEADLKKLADARVSAAGGDRDAVVSWLGRVFAAYQAPSLQGPPCTTDKAGYGRRRVGQCYDFLPGSTEEGPRLVVVPAGNGVARPYAIARHEISVGEWNAYCRLSGNCSPRGGQREQLPITNISVQEAEAYANWLSSGTKFKYRLPTQQEWTHAATATGNARVSPNCFNPQAGIGDVLLEVNWGSQNAWGIKNFVGNAQEWVVAPAGGYEARGGAHRDRLGNCEIGFSRPHAGNADALTGFRLVRELGEDA